MRKIFFILFGITIALLSGELYLRIFNRQETISSLMTTYDFHCFQAKNYYWNGLKPNSDCLLKSNYNAFSDTFIKTNSMGLRNPEIEKEKPKDTIRILFLGDSYTLGWGVLENEAYPRVVESILQKKFPDKKIEVINAGVTATGVDYEYLFLKYEGVALKPDIVVIGFHPYTDIVEDANTSIWQDIDSDGFPNKVESKSTYVDSSTGQLFLKEFPLKLKIPVLRHSYLFSFLMDHIFPDKNNYNLFYEKDKICLYNKDCRDLDTAKDLVKKSFTGIQKLLSKNSIPLLVIVKPTEYQVYPNKELLRQKYAIFIPLSPDKLSYPNRLFEDFFVQQGISYLDLIPILQAAKDKPLFFERDDHWNSLGHKVVAESVSKKLEEYILKVNN